MNRERAETYLRLVAEAELRRAAVAPGEGAATPAVMPGAEPGALVVRQRSAVAAALYDLPIRQREVLALQYYGNLTEAETAAALRITRGAVHSHSTHVMSALRAALGTGTSSRVAQIAQVLTAVGAVDREVADQIVDGFVLALGTRRVGPAGQPGPDPRSLMRSPVAHLPLGMLVRSRPPTVSTRAAAPGRVIPLGQVIPVRGDDVSGEMHLLSYAQTAPGARLTVITRARGEFVPPGIEHNGMYQPFAVFPVHQFTVRDDHGTSYRMGNPAAPAGPGLPARDPASPGRSSTRAVFLRRRQARRRTHHPATSLAIEAAVASLPAWHGHQPPARPDSNHLATE